ncbi:substrate-binding domain-containing protein [Rhodococcus sp. JS3073]|uniref:substrate-binding domain-containing protein n=1 Tax=Rhodococcus sp. JS3073 TaxID=3002901 RepID=UPI0022860532|nr:substrate-binding domain-containing protein [Rhodococcus sp. JS3073]WAM19016.1 substrate-binding domain-containing protein [Rhodococcus sp. JS3073]
MTPASARSRNPKPEHPSQPSRRRYAVVAAALLVAGAATGCTSNSASSAAGADCDTTSYDAAIAAYTSGGVIGKGPYGETSAPATSIELTDAEVAQIRAMNATAAVVMHFSGDSWSNAQVEALKAEFDTLGIRIVAQTDAQADPAKQFSDIETALSAKPNVMVSIPSLDPVALAPAYRKAADAGVKLVFMENPAKNFQPGQDYVSVVATDNYGAGVLGAHQMAKALCGNGEVGVIHHGAQAPTNVLREQGFTETIEKDYPDITIVENKGLLGPDWKGEGNSNVNAWLTKHPQLGGVWCFFDAPCEGAIDAARASGRDELAVTTVDLGNNVAIDMAQNGFVTGIAAAQPYDQGAVEAKLAAYALLGKPAPAFVELPSLPVTRDNLVDSWTSLYHSDAPSDLQQALDSGR